MKRRNLIKSVPAIVAASLMGTEAFSSTSASTSGNDNKIDVIYDVFSTRRSVREFKSDPIPEEHIKKIIEIAATAPSYKNRQPWKFLVVQDRTKIKQLRAAIINKVIDNLRAEKPNYSSSKINMERQYYEKYADRLFKAPVFIVVFADKSLRFNDFNIYDGSLAAGYLMIAARAYGYGTVFTTDIIEKNITKKIFNVPDNYEHVCFTPLGIPDHWPTKPDKKPYSDFIIKNSF